MRRVLQPGWLRLFSCFIALSAWTPLSSALFLLWTLPANAQESMVVFREDFRTLDNWKPFHFRKIEKHTLYSTESEDGEHYLRAESKAAASGLIYKGTFNVYQYSKVRWRWKVDNIYEKADGRTKTGDDYPIRLYVLFEYDPEKGSVIDKMKYGLAKAMYGEYPPHSAINYVWSSVVWDQPFISSPRSDKVKVVALKSGPNKVGTWQEEQVDVLQDYRRMFGADPPAKASLGIMCDSDNTGEHAVSFVSSIEVYR